MDSILEKTKFLWAYWATLVVIICNAPMTDIVKVVAKFVSVGTRFWSRFKADFMNIKDLGSLIVQVTNSAANALKKVIFAYVLEGLRITFWRLEINIYRCMLIANCTNFMITLHLGSTLELIKDRKSQKLVQVVESVIVGLHIFADHDLRHVDCVEVDERDGRLNFEIDFLILSILSISLIFNIVV